MRGHKGIRGWCWMGLYMFLRLRFSAVAGTDLLTSDLSASVIPTEEVRTLSSGFEGHTKRSLTRMRRRQGALRLVLRGPFHILKTRVFGGRGGWFR